MFVRDLDRETPDLAGPRRVRFLRLGIIEDRFARCVVIDIGQYPRPHGARDLVNRLLVVSAVDQGQDLFGVRFRHRLRLRCCFPAPAFA